MSSGSVSEEDYEDEKRRSARGSGERKMGADAVTGFHAEGCIFDWLSFL